MKLRRVTSHHDIWEGDTLSKTNYGTGPYIVEKIMVDDDGLVYLTLSVPPELQLPGHQYGEKYLNGYEHQPDGTWRMSNGDTFRVLKKRADGLQDSLFEAAP